MTSRADHTLVRGRQGARIGWTRHSRAPHRTTQPRQWLGLHRAPRTFHRTSLSDSIPGCLVANHQRRSMPLQWRLLRSLQHFGTKRRGLGFRRRVSGTRHNRAPSPCMSKQIRESPQCTHPPEPGRTFDRRMARSERSARCRRLLRRIQHCSTCASDRTWPVCSWGRSPIPLLVRPNCLRMLHRRSQGKPRGRHKLTVGKRALSPSCRQV